MHDTDTLFHRLFQRYPDLILALGGLPYGSDSYLFSEKQLGPGSYHLTGIFIPVLHQSDQPLVFVDVQYQADDFFYHRLISEIALYLRIGMFERTWLALAVYADRGAEHPPGAAFAPFADLAQLRRIYLEDFRERADDTLGGALLRLIASDREQAAGLARALARRRREFEADVVDLLQIVLVYKWPELSRKEIQTMLGLKAVELKRTCFYREIAEEERLKGWNDGHEKGRRRVGVALMTRLIERQFGDACPDLAHTQRKLRLLTDRQMEDFIVALLNMREFAEVDPWFVRNC